MGSCKLGGTVQPDPAVGLPSLYPRDNARKPSSALPDATNWYACAILWPSTIRDATAGTRPRLCKTCMAATPYGAALGLAMARCLKPFCASTAPRSSTRLGCADHSTSDPTA